MRFASARRQVLLLTGLTGFAGLVYEVAWERLLATLLGAHSAATAAVLALFLGGMSVGYVAFGRLSERLAASPEPVRRLLAAYGVAEICIGLHALAFVPLLETARHVSLLLPALTGPLAFTFDVGLAALVVLPGAVLMGGTIPCLTQALSRGRDDATRIHAQIYGWNTVGAFAGALAAGFWLVDALGLAGVLRAMALVNGFAGAAFVVIGRSVAVESPAPAGPAVSAAAAGVREPAAAGFDAFSAIALLAGFAMMTLQTVLIRLGALALGASQHTFSLVVATFIACLAAGSFGVSALRRVPVSLLPVCLWGMVAIWTLLFGPLENVTWAAHALRSFFGNGAADFARHSWSIFAALLVVVGAPVLLSGATLPLVFHHVRREGHDLGARAGSIYGWNTLGSLLGALFGGYLLLYWLDLHEVYRLAVVALAAAALLATSRALGLVRGRAALAFVGVVGLLALLPGWSQDRLAAGVYREREALPGTFEGPDAFFAANDRGVIRFQVDDPTATISVKEGVTSSGAMDRAIVTNGKSDGFAIGERKTTGLLGLVPALLARQAERAFVIGYGTGVTAAELASLSQMREVVVAEISPGVIDAAPWFDWANGAASKHPELRIEEADAYRVLLRDPGDFDVVVSEPSNPWVMGVEMLYSREFLSAARDSLRPGGVHAQWFHLYDLDRDTVALILRTYASVFEEVAVWFTLDFDLLLVGVRGDPAAALDVARLEERAQRPDFAAALARSGVENFPALLAHELLPLGVLGALELPGSLHTLHHPRLGHAAARAFFAGARGELPLRVSKAAIEIGRERSLVGRHAARLPAGLRQSDRSAIVRETCRHRPRECATLLAAWQHAEPTSLVRRVIAGRDVPAHILGTPLPFVVDTLATFYGGIGPRSSGDPMAAAIDATRRFLHFYHHAAPFEPEVLGEFWERCEASGFAGACDAPRAQAEAVIGLRNPPVVNRSRS
jgi:predicted membrane-bound spermidine synthase